MLVLSFTIAAAAEMHERVAREVHNLTAKERSVTTFHSFCRTHAEK